MLMMPTGVKIFVATTPVDMRKGHDGLATIIQATLNQDIYLGNLFVFFSKTYDRVKIFYWDRNGYCFWYKRLEKGRFKLPRISGKLFTLNAQELCLLLEGIDLTHPQRFRVL